MWYIPIIPALGILRQEVVEFKSRLSYIARPYLGGGGKWGRELVDLLD
jgi:hypothetical protein